LPSPVSSSFFSPLTVDSGISGSLTPFAASALAVAPFNTFSNALSYPGMAPFLYLSAVSSLTESSSS